MEYELFLGDCLDVLRQLPAQSVNLVLTDPPYNIGVTTMKNEMLLPIVGTRSTVILTGASNG